MAVAVRSAGTPSNGFVAYYTAARLLAEGAGAARFYDDAWFQEHVARFEPGVRDTFWANPPTMGLLLLPLAWAPYPLARTAWILTSFVLLLATAWWLVRACALRGVWAGLFLTAVFFSHPVRENVSHGQVYLLALALLTAAWQGWRTGRWALAGVPLGILLVTKTASLLLWPLLLVQRSWRALVWGVTAAVVVALAALPLTGSEAWTLYTSEAAELTSEPLLAVTAYQTLLGFFRHLFGSGGPVVGEPLASLPTLARVLAWACLSLLFAVSLFAALRGRCRDCAFSAFVLLGLIVSPVSSEAHYAMALLPVALLTSELVARGTPRSGRWALFMGTLLMTAPLPFRSPRLADGLLALFAYPRLYGALLLLGLALAWSRRSVSDSSAADFSSKNR
jgi:alpha-1,2-mannosyltransferase